MNDLARRIDAALPQTQCTRCGFPDCASYAQAIAAGEAAINQCPPGGREGVERLAALTGQAVAALNPANGIERPVTLAVIDENWCIGCTLCIKACPTDAIVGASKLMHTVMESYCTGCALCLPPCPVDCIEMLTVSGIATGWSAWSEQQARQARSRYEFAKQRRRADAALQSTPEARQDTNATCEVNAPPQQAHAPGTGAKQQAAQAALIRARARRAPATPEPEPEPEP